MVARGPQGLAVSKSGEVFVLDSVNGRVLGITDESQRIVIQDLASDAEDLALGADGAFVVHRPLQAKAWVFDPNGAPAGELGIPRSFRSLVGIAMGSSRDIVLQSAYQETYSVGSPAAPKDLATILSQKQEGAFLLDDGRGVAARAKEGVAELVLLRKSGGEGARTRVSQSHSIAGEVHGAQLVGMSGDIACLRLERVEQQGGTIEVERRAHCMNVQTGASVYESEMASPAIYRPRHELALGGNIPVLAALKPTTDGLTIEACEVLR